jgi:ribosomal protein S24E
MELIKIIKEIKNPLFKRKEIVFEVKSEVSPTREQIKHLAKEKFKLHSDGIIIKNILGKFGRKLFVITINAYEDEKEMLETEAFSKKEKEQLKKKKEASAKPKEENKVEVSSE